MVQTEEFNKSVNEWVININSFLSQLKEQHDSIIHIIEEQQNNSEYDLTLINDLKWEIRLINKRLDVMEKLLFSLIGKLNTRQYGGGKF